MGRIIGIDLGTTTSEIAYVKDGKPCIIRNIEEGDEHAIPSVVSIEGDEIKVGKKAKNQIELTESESFSVADAYAWVLEGRYDAYFSIKLSFEEAVQKEDGAYHQYADQLTWFPYKGIETYPLIHKNSTNKEFAKEYDKAVKELQEDGTIAKLSEKYFGEDVFSYVTD